MLRFRIAPVAPSLTRAESLMRTGATLRLQSRRTRHRERKLLVRRRLANPDQTAWGRTRSRTGIRLIGHWSDIDQDSGRTHPQALEPAGGSITGFNRSFRYSRAIHKHVIVDEIRRSWWEAAPTVDIGIKGRLLGVAGSVNIQGTARIAELSTLQNRVSY